MNASFRTRRRVEFRDTDAAGIAHFSVFFQYMEAAEHEWLRARGLSVIERDAEGLLSWPRVAVRCEYQGAVKFEDLLDVELTIPRIGEKSITYAFRFEHEGRPVANGEITAVCCRFDDGRPRSIPIPPAIRARLESIA